jgi:ornithine cyclodeaminase
VGVIERALADGLDPAADPPRDVLATAHGQLLLMPAEAGGHVGVKVASVAPGNAARGLATVQAVYVLMDAATLTPIATLDGTALTSLRTPSVSAVAARHLAAPDAARLVVFGSGPQAWGHVEALRAVCPLAQAVVVGRDPARTRAFAERVTAAGLPASAGEAAAVADADVVVCATTAGEPLFDGRSVRAHACVIAVGSHEPHRRELDARLLARATVVVEDPATALREAGDVILAVAEGAIEAGALTGLADVVTGRAAADPGRPRVFKGVGMAWQDLVTAAEVHRRWRAGLSSS